MSLTVDLVLDTQNRSALYYCATLLQKNIQDVEINLIDHRTSCRSTADITHYFTWYLHQQSLVKADDERSLVTLHHISKAYPYVAEIIRREIPIVAMSTEWYQLLKQMGADKEKLALVPHGIDTDFWNPSRSGITPNPFTVGLVGRVYEEGRKGERIVPQILEQLMDNDLRVVIVGQGWGPIVKKLKSTGVNVEYFTDLDLHSLRAVYQSFSVFLCTSDVEGGPLPLLEAMSMGITPVSTPVGLARDLLPGRGIGYLYPKGNAYAAATLLRNLQSKQLPMIASNKLRDSAELLSWPNAAEGYKQVYQAIEYGKMLPPDPTYFRDAINNRKLKALERLSLFSNPYPTDRWTQPLLWRTIGRLGKFLLHRQSRRADRVKSGS